MSSWGWQLAVSFYVFFSETGGFWETWGSTNCNRFSTTFNRYIWASLGRDIDAIYRQKCVCACLCDYSAHFFQIVRGELPMRRCSLLVGLRSSSQSLDQLALLFREFWRISWRFRGAMTNGRVGHIRRWQTVSGQWQSLGGHHLWPQPFGIGFHWRSLWMFVDWENIQPSLLQWEQYRILWFYVEGDDGWPNQKH